MIAYTGTSKNGTAHIYVSTSSDGLTWNPPIQITRACARCSSLIQCQDGSYMIAYFIDYPGTIFVTKSPDGQEWEKPIYAYNGTNQIASISLIQTRNGPYMIAYKQDAGDGDDIWVITSDHGFSWSTPVLAYHIFFEPTFNYLDLGSLIQRADRSYSITCVYAIFDRDEYYLVLLDSDDGVDWRFRGWTPIPSSYYFGASMIQCQDLSCIIAFDYALGGPAHVYTVTSDDGGLWSEPRRVTTEGDSSQPSLIQLKDGEYMMAFAFSKYGRNEIYVTKSADGVEWSTPTPVTSAITQPASLIVSSFLFKNWKPTTIVIIMTSMAASYVVIRFKRPQVFENRRKLSGFMFTLGLVSILAISFYPAQMIGRVVNFSLTDVHGETYRLRDFRGRVVLLDFMATWCLPCRSSMPMLTEMHDEFGEDVVFISISVDPTGDTEEKLMEWATTYNSSWAYVRDLADPPLAQRFKIKGLPTFILVDENGRVAYIHLGKFGAEELRMEILELLDR